MSDYTKTIQKRLSFLGGVVVVSVAIIGWRMFQISIEEHSHYVALAESQQRFNQTEIAQRGKIYVHDSYSNPNSYYPLAFDVNRFNVWVVPNQVSNKEETANELSSLLGMPANDIFNLINNNKLYIPPVKKDLGLDDANKIKAKNITGVMVMPENARYYPEDTLASQVLGFVNADGDGQYGFEGYYNNELKGTAGNVKGEKDTLGRVIDLLEQQNPKNGTNYVLTIDRSVQYFVEKQLAQAITQYQADSGSVVVMDLQTGGILAMANAPSYDPNNYKDTAKNNPSLFTNPAISGLYEPGSIFKPIIMSSAIDTGVITADTTGTFDWHTFVQGYEIKTAERKAFGLENMTQVLQNSDNVAMVWVASLLGKDNEYKYIKAFNLFDKTGIDLDGEASGYAPNFKYWQDINRSTIAFGQGISVTPIELLCAYATIANKGIYVYPHLVDKIINQDGSETKAQKQEGQTVIKPQTAATMVSMLTNVVANGGSYSRLRTATIGFPMVAKTGTAQIPQSGGGYLSNDSNLGIFEHSMAGFGPANDPRFVMLVKLDKPKTSLYAESTAEPLFGAISNYLLNNYYRLTPTQ